MTRTLACALLLALTACHPDVDAPGLDCQEPPEPCSVESYSDSPELHWTSREHLPEGPACVDGVAYEARGGMVSPGAECPYMAVLWPIEEL